MCLKLSLNDLSQSKCKLLGALIGLARATDADAPTTSYTWKLMLNGLDKLRLLNCPDDDFENLIDLIRHEKYRLVPNCEYCTARCGRTDDYDTADLYNCSADICNIKLYILSVICNISALLSSGAGVSYTDEIHLTIARCLFAIGEKWSTEELNKVANEANQLNLKLESIAR